MCCVSCRKIPIKVCKKFIVSKNQKKPSLATAQLKAHPKHPAPSALLDTYPQPMENETRKRVCQVLSGFSRQVSGSSGMPVKLVTLYIYICMYIYKYICVCTSKEQLEVGARVYRKVLTHLSEVLPRHPALSSLQLTQTANTSPPSPSLAGRPLGRQRKKVYIGLGCTSVPGCQRHIPWGKLLGPQDPGPFQSLVPERASLWGKTVAPLKWESAQLLER